MKKKVDNSIIPYLKKYSRHGISKPTLPPDNYCVIALDIGLNPSIVNCLAFKLAKQKHQITKGNNQTTLVWYLHPC
jgi:hypothetical protein